MQKKRNFVDCMRLKDRLYIKEYRKKYENSWDDIKCHTPDIIIYSIKCSEHANHINPKGFKGNGSNSEIERQGRACGLPHGHL